MLRQITTVVWSAIVLVTAGCNSGSPPADASLAEEETGEPADEVIQHFSQFYRDADSFRVESQVTVELQLESGELPPDYEPMQSTRDFLVARPNRLAFHDEQGVTVRSDGDQLFAATPDLKRYWRRDAPGALTELLGTSVASLFHGAAMMRPVALTSDDPVTALNAPIEQLRLVGTEEINGVKAHHLKVRPANSDDAAATGIEQIEIWIAAEGDPVLLQHRILHAPQRMQVAPDESINASMIVTETLSNWEFDPDQVEESVRFEPAEDALRFAGLTTVFNEPDPMIGKPAPEAVLNLIDGETRRLSDHKGQEIVILDFWATFCGPCREEMPILERLEDEYRDDGVIVYAVNLRETPESIKQFMREESLDLVAVLDPNGEITRRYKVQGIPHVVIIDREGIVQSIHVGVNPELGETEREFREEIEALISGRNISEEGLAH